jgi:hypothetical protein
MSHIPFNKFNPETYMKDIFEPIFKDLMTEEISCAYYGSTRQHTPWNMEYSLYGQFLKKEKHIENYGYHCSQI